MSCYVVTAIRSNDRLCQTCLLLCGIVVSDIAFAQSPGQTPPASILQELKPAQEQCQKALESMDAEAVKAAVDRAIKILGPWAGNPSRSRAITLRIQTESPDFAKLRQWWEREIERNAGALPWIKNPDGDPRIMTAGLRAAAWPVDALARSANLLPQHRAELTKQAKEGGIG